MAKTSKISKQLLRERIVAKYAERRAQYKRDSVNPHLTAEQRAEAMRRLHALPRDASPTRLRNRDAIDGRPRGFIRAFGCRASICARKRTGASCRASRNPAGDAGAASSATAQAKKQQQGNTGYETGNPSHV